MNRHRIIVSALICFIAVGAFAAASHVPKTNTREAVVKYVTDAAAIVRKSGPSCATFSSTAWRAGDYYIFVLGPDAKLVCHPTASMIGKPADQIVNSEGEKVGEMIAKAGTGDNKGWVDYLWAKPGKTAEERKSSYAMGVTGPDKKHYVVGAGAWDLKK